MRNASSRARRPRPAAPPSTPQPASTGPGSAAPPAPLREYPPRALTNEVLALHERWQSRDIDRTTPGENEAADACFYALSVLVMMIRAPGTPLARFIEGQVDLLSDAARAIERGERTAYGQPDAKPAAARGPVPPAAASPTPGPAPRQARPSLRVLGIEHEHDGKTIHDANPVELLAWSYCGDPSADPIDGILDSMEDDLSILQSAIASSEQPLDDATLLMQIFRLQCRAEAAHLLYQRVMTAAESSARAEAPARSAPTEPAAYKMTHDVRWQTEDMIDRAARFLDTFAELVDRRTALDQENVVATTRLAVRAAGDTAREMLRQALAIAEMDAKQAATTEEQLRFVDIIDWLRAALEGVEAAAEQNEKTRFRRRERRMKACGAMLRAQGELRKARESAAAASAAKRAAMAKGAAK
jgi:hypothetical protein